MAKGWVIGFALFAPSGKNGKNIGFALFAPSGKSGKRMGNGICTFCTMRQKWQKDGLWDLHFLHNEANVAKG